MEKNHTSARNAKKTSVAETSQQWCFCIFLTKNEVAGVGSFGGTPPTPPGNGNFCQVLIFQWTHTGEKAIQLLEMQQKVILNETLQNWRVFYMCWMKMATQFCEKYLKGPILEKNHSRARAATKTYYIN